MEDWRTQRMASLLALHPDKPEMWPLGLIRRLIDLEDKRGTKALDRELEKLMRKN